MRILRKPVYLERTLEVANADCARFGVCCLNGVCCKHMM